MEQPPPSTAATATAAAVSARSPLLCRCVSGSTIKLFRSALRHGAPIDVRTSDGRNPYWLCAFHNNEEALVELLSVPGQKRSPLLDEADQVLSGATAR